MSDYDYWIKKCYRNSNGTLIYKGPGKSPWIDFLLKGRELEEIFLSRINCNGSYQYNLVKETLINEKKNISFVYSSDDDSLVEPPKERKKYRKRKGKKMRKKTPGLSKKITRNRTKERCHKYERTIGDYEAEHDEMWIYDEDSYPREHQEREEYYDAIEYNLEHADDIYCDCLNWEMCHKCCNGVTILLL